MAASPAAATTEWTLPPYDDLPRFDAQSVIAQWPRLHGGQGVQQPPSDVLCDGWVHYHNGHFEQAVAAGLALGPDGEGLVNQATAIYANYLEPREGVRLGLFRQVCDRAAAQVAVAPDNRQALYWHAYALGRYSQGVSVARALAQGLGSKLKGSLERLIALQPDHADAHLALGAFHAEVIDKVGPLVGRMTYGVRAETAIELLERGLVLNPHSASGHMEYARALLMLQGDVRMADATRLYEQGAALVPADARERLDAELARAGLAE